MLTKEVITVIGLAIGYLMLFMIGLLHDVSEKRKQFIEYIVLGFCALCMGALWMRKWGHVLIFSYIPIFFIGLMFHVSDARKGHIRNVVRVCTVLIWSILIFDIYNR